MCGPHATNQVFQSDVHNNIFIITLIEAVGTTNILLKKKLHKKIEIKHNSPIEAHMQCTYVVGRERDDKTLYQNKNYHSSK
jgi:hypothetical protein